MLMNTEKHSEYIGSYYYDMLLWLLCVH